MANSDETARRMAEAIRKYVGGALAAALPPDKAGPVAEVLNKNQGQLYTDLANAFRFGGFDGR